MKRLLSLSLLAVLLCASYPPSKASASITDACDLSSFANTSYLKQADDLLIDVGLNTEFNDSNSSFVFGRFSGGDLSSGLHLVVMPRNSGSTPNAQLGYWGNDWVTQGSTQGAGYYDFVYSDTGVLSTTFFHSLGTNYLGATSCVADSHNVYKAGGDDKTIPSQMPYSADRTWPSATFAPPPACPTGQTGTYPNCVTPPPPPPPPSDPPSTGTPQDITPRDAKLIGVVVALYISHLVLKPFVYRGYD